jgi:Asp-tRNA(Asn)/Glu-tRNA(Gln) amidotransferase A subunit family amidase
MFTSSRKTSDVAQMPKDQEPLTIHEAAAAIRAGALSPVDLLEQCLARIELYEPQVRAWVAIDRDGAGEQAERLTAELKRGHDRGPLHGIPIGVKDIIDVFDLPTGCGSKLWANSIARRDADCVRRLRQAGAIILGKTVTTPFAYLDPPITRNPWNLERTPGGSSSGSAAAVACGMCLGALGSQTGGSITRPAAFCGVCSMKPSYGSVSVGGVLPLAPSLDHVGVMARCVTDVAILFQAVAGRVENHKTGSRSWPVPEVVQALSEARTTGGVSLSRRVFQRARGLFETRAEPEMREAMNRMVYDLRSLASADAVVEDVALPAGFAELHANHRIIMAVEAAEYHATRLRRHPDDYPPRIRELIEEGLAFAAVDDSAARQLRDELDWQMDELVPGGGLALLTPAAPGAAPGPSTTGDAVFNAPWSFTGHPTVSFPVARGAEGLPLAVQIVGARDGEDSLLVRAAWCEERVGHKTGLPPVP